MLDSLPFPEVRDPAVNEMLGLGAGWLIQTTTQFEEAIAWIESAPVIAIDTETTGLHPYEGDRLIGVSVADDNHQIYFPFRHRIRTSPHPERPYPEGWNLTVSRYLPRLLEALSAYHSPGSGHSERKLLIFHNQAFDQPILEADGWPALDTVDYWDTKVVAWLIDENIPHGLKDLSVRFLDPAADAEQADIRDMLRKRAGEARRSWADLTPAQTGQYAAFDARLTYDLWQWQARYVAEHPDEQLDQAIPREMAFLRVLLGITKAGVPVDTDAVRAGLQARYETCARIQERFGDVNLNTPALVATLLYDRWNLPASRQTGKGDRSVDRYALQDLLVLVPADDPRHQALLDILEFRRASKAASAYFGSILQHLGADGRIHPSFNQAIGAEKGGKSSAPTSGRLSCSSPNLQTIPKEEVLPDVRAVFKAPAGYELWEHDLAQAEMRVAADYSRDTAMLRDVQTEDLHSATADRVFGRHDGLYRRMAKNLNFGFLYGVGPATFAATAAKGGIQMSEEEAREHLNRYARAYPNLKRAFNEAMEVARTRGFVRLCVPGRRRHFVSPGLKYPRYYTAFNVLCQGGVADFQKLALTRLAPLLPSHGATMVLPIHDSIVIQVPEGGHHSVNLLVDQAFSEVNPFDVPMPLDHTRWSK